MELRILGPLEVVDGKGSISLGGPKQRAVLAHLALQANRVVPAERLIDEIWGEDPPPAARSALQSYVSHLRKAVGSDRLVGRLGGYVLHAASDEIDASRFEALVAEARRLAVTDPAEAVLVYQRALALWIGPALHGLGDQPSRQPKRPRLKELWMVATEGRISAELDLGRHRELVPELETFTGRHPFREHLWGHLMLALYRSGRQAEALAAYRRARDVLADELGIDPSPRLQRLHEQLLRQDGALDLKGEPLRGYRMLESIGEGAYGSVHRAFQPEVGREVAVKVVHPHLSNHPEFIRRFGTEAQLVARLEHPHIVPLYDYWREPDGAYLVMRYLRGGSLRDLLAHGPLEADLTARLTDQVALALTAAHRQGVVHREGPRRAVPRCGGPRVGLSGSAACQSCSGRRRGGPQSVQGSPTRPRGRRRRLLRPGGSHGAPVGSAGRAVGGVAIPGSGRALREREILRRQGGPASRSPGRSAARIRRLVRRGHAPRDAPLRGAGGGAAADRGGSPVGPRGAIGAG